MHFLFFSNLIFASPICLHLHQIYLPFIFFSLHSCLFFLHFSHMSNWNQENQKSNEKSEQNQKSTSTLASQSYSSSNIFSLFGGSDFLGATWRTTLFLAQPVLNTCSSRTRIEEGKGKKSQSKGKESCGGGRLCRTTLYDDVDRVCCRSSEELVHLAPQQTPVQSYGSLLIWVKELSE